ncbi:sulfotransferase [Sphingobium sp. H33]|uniref:Sulfotransferase n=2 Tax=Sphingobium nicotianae TaxID=2782607 RepID=A0A9X1IQN2_9SPHN|nr:sulfotransferase [Sphingobium nicotianae]
MAAGDLAAAHRILAARLTAEPDDVPTLHLFAQVAGRIGKQDQGFALLARAIELAPPFEPALALARRFLDAMAPAEALAVVEAQLARQPGHPGYRSFKAGLLERAGDYDGAIALHRALLADAPQSPGGWTALGHVLEMTGRTQEAIAAYRRALAIAPAHGEAWWSLANIKANRFAPDDVAAMRALLARPDLPPQARMLTDFALGKALEDAGEPDAAFVHYAQGNALRRQQRPYDHAVTLDQLDRARRLFRADFFAAREGQGDRAPDPIFIVGLPRSGSTLVEQILASHPAVEGTMELPHLPRIAGRIGRYPEGLADLDGEALSGIGRDYLAQSAAHRHDGKPHFIDKLPANFRHVGLIRAALPHAKIIDVRRHPLACGFSCFRQYFASGFDFANDLTDLGEYYRAYVALMVHWDAVLPGHVHRIFYEELVADMPGEVERLLAYVGLPFDAACLRPHETARAVRTPSASQVRQPLYREGLESWRAFAPWLGPLEAALGDVLARYPAAPQA